MEHHPPQLHGLVGGVVELHPLPVAAEVRQRVRQELGDPQVAGIEGRERLCLGVEPVTVLVDAVVGHLHRQRVDVHRPVVAVSICWRPPVAVGIHQRLIGGEHRATAAHAQPQAPQSKPAHGVLPPSVRSHTPPWSRPPSRTNNMSVPDVAAPPAMGVAAAPRERPSQPTDHVAGASSGWRQLRPCPEARHRAPRTLHPELVGDPAHSGPPHHRRPDAGSSPGADPYGLLQAVAAETPPPHAVGAHHDPWVLVPCGPADPVVPSLKQTHAAFSTPRHHGQAVDGAHPQGGRGVHAIVALPAVRTLPRRQGHRGRHPAFGRRPRHPSAEVRAVLEALIREHRPSHGDLAPRPLDRHERNVINHATSEGKPVAGHVIASLQDLPHGDEGLTCDAHVAIVAARAGRKHRRAYAQTSNPGAHLPPQTSGLEPPRQAGVWEQRGVASPHIQVSVHAGRRGGLVVLAGVQLVLVQRETDSSGPRITSRGIG